LFNQLPPDARKAVVEAFAAIKPVLAIPAVGAIIKPTVDAIRAKLDTLATT
jgi:isocitrate dehydrogenase